MSLLLDLARQASLAEKMAAMFSGEKIIITYTNRIVKTPYQRQRR